MVEISYKIYYGNSNIWKMVCQRKFMKEFFGKNDIDV